MKKNLPLLILVAIVALVVGGYLGYSSLTEQKARPTLRNTQIPRVKVAGDDSSSGKQSKSAEGEKNISRQTFAEANVPEADPDSGERIVWGEVKAVDIDQRIITIDQDMDDNSVKVSPNVPVGKDAVVRARNGVISLAQVKLGDSVGIIITKEGQARAVFVNY